MEGYIHSIETFGTVDGPGVRFVVFFQGCPMRCQYCHNPDTWNLHDGTKMDVDEILKRYERNKSFYKTGGITATGGEPMYQIDFLTELFSKAKEMNIHTCLDTSGILFPEDVGKEFPEISLKKIDELLAVTDLVMLDIKHMDDECHQKLTMHSNQAILKFARYLDQMKKSVWIRHVVVPGITYDESELKALGHFLATLSNVEKIDVLPYHAMGKVKYENLGIDYPLADTRQLTKDEVMIARKYIEEGMAESKTT